MFKMFRDKSKRVLGFSLVEIVVVLGITATISAIAIPKFVATKSRGYFQTAQSDGDNLYREITQALSEVESFGTSNGTIALDTTTNTMTITLGVGGDSIPTFVEKVSTGTTVSGKTYATGFNWCLDVVNNGQHVLYNQDGVTKTVTACGATPGSSV